MSLENKTPDEINALAALSENVLGNPATRREFQKMLKKNNPGVSIPELENEERIVEAVKPHIDRISALEAKMQQDAAISQANDLYTNLRDHGAVSSKDDFNGLVKYASEKGFATSEQGLKMASRFRQDEMSSAEPTPAPGSFGGFNMKDKSMTDWLKDPRARANEEAQKIMKERGIRH